jgi:hypothetical protein
MTRFAPTFSAVLAALFSIIPNLSPPAHAQAESASIRGSVIDPTGGIVRDAMVMSSGRRRFARCALVAERC